MPEAGGTGDKRYLVITLGRDDFALPAGVVQELLRVPELTRVPGAPGALAGLANRRGAALPVLDLRRILHPGQEPPAAATRLVVADAGEPVGLMVDRVVAFSDGAEVVDHDGQDKHPRVAVPVGSGTARLLDLRALLAEAFPRRATHAASPGMRPTAQGSATSGAGELERIALVSFTAAGRSYALPLERVAEVLALPPDVVPVPRAGAAALGVMAFRGGVLPLLSLASILGIVAVAPACDARVVVARLGGAETGLVVDALGPILRLLPDAVDPVPSALRRGGATAVDAICRPEGGAALVSVLSADRLLEGTSVTATSERSSGTVRPDEATEAGAAAMHVVVFELAGESYGLPVTAVREVLRVPETMTRLPRSPDLIAGAIEVRGTVLAVIDQRRRFGLPPGQQGSRRRIIVLDAGGTAAGLLVDSVSRLLRLPAAAVRPAPDFSDEAGSAVDRVATLDDGTLLPMVDAQVLLAGTERSLRAATKRSGPREKAGPPA